MNAQPSDEGALVGVRVLVVEDDTSSAKLLDVLLRGEGCEVQLARNGQDALTLLPLFRPQAVVLDVVLPLVSGVDMARQIKADAATADIVLIAVSAFHGTAVEGLARAAGCAAYLPKPIDVFELVALLRRHMRERGR